MESPAIEATASGRNSGSSSVSAARATKSPLDVMPEKKSGPSAGPVGGLIFTAVAMMIGTAASTASPAQLRRRPKISISSDRSSRVLTRRGALARAARSAFTCGSTADIETLSGQGNEQILQVRRLSKPFHGYARVHERGDGLLGRHRSHGGGDAVEVDGDVGRAQVAQ